MSVFSFQKAFADSVQEDEPPIIFESFRSFVGGANVGFLRRR